MRWLAIDPGTEQSGFVVVDGKDVLVSGELSNHAMVERIATCDVEAIACEWIEGRGMPVGAETFETCRWIGVFEEAARAHGKPFHLVYRSDVKLHLCHVTRAKDSNVIAAILDLYPRSGGGKKPQVGTKKQPGPLYGVSGHAWQALGLALTVQFSENLTPAKAASTWHATSGNHNYGRNP